MPLVAQLFIGIVLRLFFNDLSTTDLQRELLIKLINVFVACSGSFVLKIASYFSFFHSLDSLS